MRSEFVTSPTPPRNASSHFNLGRPNQKNLQSTAAPRYRRPLPPMENRLRLQQQDVKHLLELYQMYQFSASSSRKTDFKASSDHS